MIHTLQPAKAKWTSLLVLILLMVSCQLKKEQDSNTESSDEVEQNDEEFIQEVITQGQQQLDLAQIALSKSNDEGIIEIATVTEGTLITIMEQTRIYANKAGTVIQEQPYDSTDEANELIEMTGEAFDKKWCDIQIKMLEQLIKEFQNRMEKTEDIDLKNMMADALASLNSNLSLVQHYRQDNIR